MSSKSPAGTGIPQVVARCVYVCFFTSGRLNLQEGEEAPAGVVETEEPRTGSRAWRRNWTAIWRLYMWHALQTWTEKGCFMWASKKSGFLGWKLFPVKMLWRLLWGQGYRASQKHSWPSGTMSKRMESYFERGSPVGEKPSNSQAYCQKSSVSWCGKLGSRHVLGNCHSPLAFSHLQLRYKNHHQQKDNCSHKAQMMASSSNKKAFLNWGTDIVSQCVHSRMYNLGCFNVVVEIRDGLFLFGKKIHFIVWCFYWSWYKSNSFSPLLFKVLMLKHCFYILWVSGWDHWISTLGAFLPRAQSVYLLLGSVLQDTPRLVPGMSTLWRDHCALEIIVAMS